MRLAAEAESASRSVAAINGVSKRDALRPACSAEWAPRIRAIAAGSWEGKSRDRISSSGYVVHTLEAALWAVHRTSDFRDAVLLAANLGDDADTVAAVAGQIAGALYGASAIPRDWSDRIAWRDRKGTSIPYISHLMTVSALVIEHGGDENQAIGALLHDAAEDQGGAETLAVIRRRFGGRVADIVADCTDAWTEPKPEWRARKEAYLAKLPTKAATSLLVSLADKTHNAEAILFDYRILGDGLWPRFNGGAAGTRWYYQSLAGIFTAAMPGRLADRLERAAAAFSK